MNILYTQQTRDFQGKYLAVSKNKIIASGKSAAEAFNSAKRILTKGKKVEGVYYIPRKKDLLTALCAFPTTK
ncbi:hypothetical protein HY008_02785 [Candidatus Woesebacteria bacterium]|nr:hypothetical protein [Candidatus Woesebacteria bacterium]